MVDALRARNFARANLLVARHLAALGNEPVGRLFYAFPEQPTSWPRKPYSVVSPQGLVFRGSLPIHVRDERTPPAPKLRVILDTEGGSRSEWYLGAESRCIELNGRRYFSIPGGAARIQVVDPLGERRVVGIEVVEPNVFGELRSRKAFAERAAGGDPAIAAYLRAMLFCRERCYADAYEELEDLGALYPGDPFLGAARQHVESQLERFDVD